jgi:O-antigen ligase
VRAVQAALTAGLAALGFFLCFSVAGVSLALAALCALALLMAPAAWRSAPWREPVMATGLILLAYIAVHTLWTSGWTTASAHAVNHYQELLLAPVLLVLFRLSPRREVFFRSLAAGAAFYAALHWIALGVPQAAAFVAPRRISAGFTLAVCCFLLLEYARGRTTAWRWRALAAFLALTVVFLIEGRTGQLVLLLLAAYAGFTHSSGRWRWAAALGAPLVVLAAAVASPAVQLRASETLSGLRAVQSPAATSTGIRLELMRYGLQLARENFVAGAGFTRYGELQDRAVQQHEAGLPAPNLQMQDVLARTPNPHNEFLMQLVGGGLPALALFLAWLTLPVLRRATPRWQPGLVGLVLAFAAGCLFNSMLMDFTEGHFYVAVLAWLLAAGDPGAAA